MHRSPADIAKKKATTRLNQQMTKKRAIIIIALGAAICVFCVVLFQQTRETEEEVLLPPEVIVEEAEVLTPEQQLLGTWIQTQEYLDYENEYIHSASVTVTEKERLEFRKDGSCELTSPNRGNTTFYFEYRDGKVILTTEGWAPQLFYFEDDVLVDPETGIARFEKV